VGITIIWNYNTQRLLKLNVTSQDALSYCISVIFYISLLLVITLGNRYSVRETI